MNLLERLYYSADKHLKDATLNMLKVNPDAVLLDLGCGDCKFTSRLAKVLKAKSVYVVDEIIERLKMADDIGWHYVFGDLNQALNIPDNSFDVIHAGDVIEHLNNTDTFIKEIKRILKPSGYAIISTPNLSSWHNIASLLLGKQPLTCMVSDEMFTSKVALDKNMPKHRRIFTFDGLAKLCRYHGFKVSEVRGAGYYPFTWEILTMLDRKHSAYVIVKVTK